MQRQYVVKLDDYDQRIMIRALNDLRTSLIREERSTDAVDELMEKLYGAKGNRAKKRYKWNRNGEDIGLAWISQSRTGGRRQLFPSLSCDRQ